jgi:protoporphyrinogen oxidase
MRIGIVGGGIAGLTAGYRLSQAGHEVAVFEALPVLGGQAGTFPIDGTRLEYYYHHLFQSDGTVASLIGELGLAPKMAWLSSKMGYYHEGTIYDFVTPIDLLRFKPLPFPSRIILGLQSLWLQAFGDWRKLERVAAREWVLRWGGKAIYDVIWGALLRAKYGAYADQVSMAWLWGKLVVRRSLKGSGLRKETLGYMMGSFQQLIDALAAGIAAGGGEVHAASPVESVLVADGAAAGLLVREGDQLARRQFDAVILTVPSPVVLGMVSHLPADYASLLGAVPYQGVMVLVLKLKQSLSRIYWLNVCDASIPFVGVIEHTNYVGPEHYGGAHIVYLSNYLSADDPRFGFNKDELLAYYTPHIQRINPAFEPSWVQESWLFRDRYAQPVIGTRYSERIPPHRTPLRGLYLANTTQIYPEDRGVNYSVRLGEAISEIVQGREARVSERWR